MNCKFKFKSGDLVEVINPDRHAFYLEHGRIMYAVQKIPSNEIIYTVSFRGSFGDDISYDFEENDLQLFAEVTNNEDSKISRVEQTHKSINKFLENNAIKIQSKEERSLSIIAQMLVEINESLAIICDKLK